MLAERPYRPALALCLMFTVCVGCVPDSQEARIRTWHIDNRCDFEVGVHIGDPHDVGNDVMEQPNVNVPPSASAEIDGAFALDAAPQLWAWSRSRVDRSIIKIRIDRDGEAVVLEGKRCDFMESG